MLGFVPKFARRTAHELNFRRRTKVYESKYPLGRANVKISIFSAKLDLCLTPLCIKLRSIFQIATDGGAITTIPLT